MIKNINLYFTCLLVIGCQSKTFMSIFTLGKIYENGVMFDEKIFVKEENDKGEDLVLRFKEQYELY